MQDDLFGGSPPAPAGRSTARGPAPATVAPSAPDPAHLALAAALPARLRLGTSSWTYPGWAGLVWDGEYADATLSRHGLVAYGAHPLLRTVCIDRSFYCPLTAAQYARYAAQVPEHFRFVVKAPGSVTDALVRGEDGRGMQANPLFLNPALAVQDFVLPALEGLGARTGALVFQLSPLPPAWLQDPAALFDALRALLRALPPMPETAPDAVVAVEVRDAALLTPALAAVLREGGATCCLGLHAKMPAIAEQLPLLRALWPGPLVCRWNLNPLHGAYGYEDAQRLYSPYDRIVDVDEATRSTLARVIRATVDAGHNAFVTISNKAEGCAPLSAAGLAQAVLDQPPPRPRRAG
ncbi:MAG TPA: DUF72 domain-containing protein [Burkholderiaceae bacterium]